MMKKYFAFLFLAVLLPVMAFAADVPIHVPEGDPLQTLLQLVLNWKASAPLVLASTAIIAVVQALKTLVGEFQYKRAVIAVLGVSYGVVLALTQGMSLIAALVAAVVTSGGAYAIYEAIVKPAVRQLQKAS